MNHKWENNKCIKCGIIRAEIKSINDKEHDILMYQYSTNVKSWVIKRPDCPAKNGNEINKIDIFSIKKLINEKTREPIKDYKQEYSELLRSPKWQRKRLEIMQRDNWKCRSCNDDLNELHVHHLQIQPINPGMNLMKI